MARTTERMHPPASSEAVRRRMETQARCDTGPEMALRQRLHAEGLRYRADHRPEPTVRRRADIVFTRARVAVFVDGCFWHVCPQHGKIPKSNSAWWRDKLQANRLRDSDTNARLTAAGWTVIRVWEHEEPDAAAKRVAEAVQEARWRDRGGSRLAR